MKSVQLERDWDGETVVCVASGPSLSREDIQYIKGKARVIAINDNYRLADFADILYGCDLKWWNWQEGVQEFTGLKMSQSVEACKKYDLRYIEGRNGGGLSTDPAFIHTGSNSGFQAINIAFLKGASKIILIGYDMQKTKGESHWFGDHPDKIQSNYESWLPVFELIKEQGLVEIINCSRETALTAFPRQPLRETL